MASPGTTTERILLVGSADVASGLERVLKAHFWTCTLAETPSGVLRRIRNHPEIDLLVLAPEGSVHPYLELCREIKFDARRALVGVVFVMPLGQAESRVEAYEAGADDCIQLPAPPQEILLRLSNVLRIKHATNLLEDSTAVIISLASAIEGRDAYTHGHVERVSLYAVEIGRRVGVDAGGLEALKIGGIVHDIGKIVIPDSILHKPGKLTDVEMELVKRHPLIGYDILQPLRTFAEVRPIVRWHHERPNGKGYPDGLASDQLPLLPRIVAVADCYDALSTPRPYRPAFSTSKCRDILSAAAEHEDLDPALVAVLLEILEQKAGTLVGASTGGISG